MRILSDLRPIESENMHSVNIIVLFYCRGVIFFKSEYSGWRNLRYECFVKDMWIVCILGDSKSSDYFFI